MKSAREAMIRGGPARVERALMGAAPAIAEALRDPRWQPPPPPLSLFVDGDGDADTTATTSGSYAPPADQAEAYRALEAPVRRLRLAREACTALGIGRGRRGGVEETEDNGGADDGSGVPLSLAVRVYEASADAAAAMLTADGELLKALSGLCGSIYPALRRQQEQAAAGAQLQLLAREGEMRAAFVLFYACMPARPLPQNLAQCLSAEGLAPYWQEEVEKAPTPKPTARDRRLLQAALRGASAALSGDWVGFGSCYAMMPRVPRHVMARCLPRMRAHAVRCMARCFAPSLPVAVAERWLGLRVAKSSGGNDKHAPLVSLLEDAARDGCKGSTAALAAREQARRKRADAVWSGGGGGDSWEERAEDDDNDDDDGFVDLVFKPPPSAIAGAANKPQN
jgi:hypothetical protein